MGVNTDCTTDPSVRTVLILSLVSTEEGRRHLARIGGLRVGVQTLERAKPGPQSHSFVCLSLLRVPPFELG
jgi:hypothetical protein